MQFSVIGHANQCVVAQMSAGDEIRADVGSMLLLSDGVVLESAYNGGVGADSRSLKLEAPVPLTFFRCTASLGVVAFAAPGIGEVRRIEVQGSAWYCSREAFLFCTEHITATVGAVHRSAGEYYSERGCILYRLSGHGDAYIHCGGSVIEYNLVEGQRVSVDIGCVAAYQDSVTTALELVEGLPRTDGSITPIHLMTLTGPGKIVLATVPQSRLPQPKPATVNLGNRR